jgi:hypothetical protein
LADASRTAGRYVLGKSKRGGPIPQVEKEENMTVQRRTLSGERALTVAGLVVGAAGIAVLWASGVEFPVAIPPGLVILLVGALFVGVAPWRWATGVGAFLGLFVTFGFLVSGGMPNLVGGDGNTFFGTPNPIESDTLGTIIGTWIQMIGVLTALIAGVIATRNNYRKPTHARQ